MFGICLAGVIAMIIERVNKGDQSVWYSIPNLAVLGILGAMSLCFAVFIWVLFFYHVVLIATNQTTTEYLKQFKDNHPRNPFSA
jgi:ABC-type proline/glycine betaine transport system permease subunit